MRNGRQLVSGAAIAGAMVATLAFAIGGDLQPRGVTPAHAAQPSPGPAGASPSRYLRFTGTGVARVKPDTATISFMTSGESSSKGSALNTASAAMRRVIAAMQHNGISKPDLETSSDVYHDTTRGIYQASESLQVTVHEVDVAGQLVATGLNAGADSASGPEFSLTNQNAGYDAALRAAVQNARSHADAAASLVGIHVTGVLSIDDVPVSGGEPIYGALAAPAQDRTLPVPVRRGLQQVSVTLTVTFAYANG